jgi:hypothetical protein
MARPLEEVEADNERLRAALDEIVHPLKYMQERAEKEGSRLSGMAFSIATSTAHLQGIASRALGEQAPAAHKTDSDGFGYVEPPWQGKGEKA